MSLPQAMGFVTILLQLIVAGYALRLNHLFGTARVGWSLFWAFSLLAVLHSFQSAISLSNGESLVIEIEVVYSLISLLLLTGLVHIESLLRERQRVEQAEKRMQDGLEFMVKEKTAHLTKAIEDLQVEIAERKRMESEFEKTKNELFAATRRAAMAEFNKSVLFNVENILKSVNASTALIADQMAQSKISNVVRISNLLLEHKENWNEFVTRDPQGQKLPEYIAQLARHLVEERATLTTELDFIHKNVEHLKSAVAMEHNGAKLADETTVTRATTFIEAAILKSARAGAHSNGRIPRT